MYAQMCHVDVVPKHQLVFCLRVSKESVTCLTFKNRTGNSLITKKCSANNLSNDILFSNSHGPSMYTLSIVQGKINYLQFGCPRPVEDVTVTILNSSIVFVRKRPLTSHSSTFMDSTYKNKNIDQFEMCLSLCMYISEI